MVKFKGSSGEEVAYGIIQKILTFELGGDGQQVVFMIKWLKSHGKCDHTHLQKVGGLHEEWNNSYPFQDGSDLCAGNVNFWPQKPLDAILDIEEPGAAYFAIESRVHSH